MRNDWTFNYPASEVATGAREKYAHHRERIAWWLDQQEAAERELRSKGVEFRDRDVTGGKRVEAVIDPELSRRLEECRQKVAHHERLADEYGAYLAVCEANFAVMLELSVSDVRWFGLA